MACRGIDFSSIRPGFVDFKKWTPDHLLDDRVPRIAGWRRDHRTYTFVAYLRDVKDRIFSHFDIQKYIEDPFYPDSNWGFGWGTVHHACGTLRMPWKAHRDQQDWNHAESVVDGNLQVKNAPGLYVCDMSVMPISTAANPVRALGALALRLSKHLQDT